MFNVVHLFTNVFDCFWEFGAEAPGKNRQENYAQYEPAHTEDDCRKLEELTVKSEQAATWYEHHRHDVQFHRHCTDMSALPEVEAYLEIYHTLHQYFVPYPMEKSSLDSMNTAS